MVSNQISVEGMHYKENRPVRICVENGIIQSIEEIGLVQENMLTIAPGLVDLQVNGYMGIDFNDSQVEVEELRKVFPYLLNEGVTSFFPTIITNSYENIKILVQRIYDLMQEDELARSMIAGIHLEGPFLSKEDGPRGAHNVEFIKEPDWAFFTELNASVKGLIKIVTISPEWDRAVEFIDLAVKKNIHIAIGHTSANAEQINRAVKAGATLSTHLGNGAHPVLPRHPNYIWDQLSEDALVATVIADGFHLPESILTVFEKVKRNKMILISDSVALAGLSAGDYVTSVGGEVTMTDYGKLHLKDNPLLLAGSAQSILYGVNHLLSIGLNTLDEAIEKASVLPSSIVQLPQKDGLKVGAPADLIFVRREKGQISVINTMKAGKILVEKGAE